MSADWLALLLGALAVGALSVGFAIGWVVGVAIEQRATRRRLDRWLSGDRRTTGDWR